MKMVNGPSNNSTVHITARAVIIKDSHILLCFDPRSPPGHYYELGANFYYLPGGHIDFKEHAKCAVTREIMEETGYNSTCDSFLGVVEYAWNSPLLVCHTHEINLIFKVDIDTDSCVNVEQKEEHVAFNWLPLDNLDSIDLRPPVLKKYIPIWLREENDHTFVTQE